MDKSTKTVLITGTSSGFGRAASKLFAANGWNVIATMRSPEQENELTQFNNVLITRLDVQDLTSIEQAVKAGFDRFGSLDALVNNAGYGSIGIFETASREHIQRQFDVNVFGLMDVTRAVLPYFRAQRSGVIINLSSFGGRVALPTGTLYNTSKFAVEGFSESLAYESSAINVRVKLIEPGGVSTNFGASLDFITNTLPEYEDVRTRFLSRYASPTAHLQRATANEVAQAIYQAATDGTDQLRYVVGQDAEFYINTRQQNRDQDFIDQMRAYFID
ncbi:SDR family oxidoreductase [Spirosoma koreense]